MIKLNVLDECFALVYVCSSLFEIQELPFISNLSVINIEFTTGNVFQHDLDHEVNIWDLEGDRFSSLFSNSYLSVELQLS